MKLYEAVKQAIEANGTDIVKDTRLVDILDGLHAYDDIPSAKRVLQSVITDGYCGKLLDIGEWNVWCNGLVERFVSETGVQKAVAELVFKSLAYGIGWIKDESEMVPSSSSSSPLPQPSPTPAQSPKPSLDPSDLTLTAKQVMTESEAFRQRHIAVVEKYLGGIVKIEHNTDKYLSNVEANVTFKYDLRKGVSSILEIKGAGDFGKGVGIRFVMYDALGHVIGQAEGKLKSDNKTYRIVSTAFIPSKVFQTISNISNIVVRWEESEEKAKEPPKAKESKALKAVHNSDLSPFIGLAIVVAFIALIILGGVLLSSHKSDSPEAVQMSQPSDLPLPPEIVQMPQPSGLTLPPEVVQMLRSSDLPLPPEVERMLQPSDTTLPPEAVQMPQPSDLTLTSTQVKKMPEAFKVQHISAVEKHLDSLLQVENYPPQDSGFDIPITFTYDLRKGIRLNFEVKEQGKWGKYVIGVALRAFMSDTLGHVVGQTQCKLKPDNKKYRIIHTAFIPIRKFRTISNIGKITVRWEEEVSDDPEWVKKVKDFIDEMAK